MVSSYLSSLEVPFTWAEMRTVPSGVLPPMALWASVKEWELPHKVAN